MSQYLYVCHFSNGHIKVGRSINPVSRVAQHAERVACMGVELIEHHTVLCVSHVAPSEAALIQKCCEVAEKKFKNEWFSGVDYPLACNFANQSAATVWDFSETETASSKQFTRAVEIVGSVLKMSKVIGLSTNMIYQVMRGDRPVPATVCHEIEVATGGVIGRAQLQPAGFEKLWPELSV